MDKNNRLYYIICVTHYVSGCGVMYQIFTNKHYDRYLVNGNVRYKERIGDVYLRSTKQSPYYCDYETSYYKFETFKDAMDKAIELVRSGVLPNYGISKEVGQYGDKTPRISILQRPLGDVVGYRYAKYLEDNKDNDNIKTPLFKAGDSVYLTTIEDGDVIYKTKVTDCELDENGNWRYYTTYWFDYPYNESGLQTEEEFKKHYKVMIDSGNGYYRGQRCKIVEC